ncbi:DUF4340 domain-containing protein [bacterium]|nr:DUF4340 domain-containing protein [bacterium]
MKKSTIIVIVIFLLLVGIYVLISLFSKGEKTSTVESDILDLDSLKVEYIELNTLLEKVVLEKKGDMWMVTEPGEYEANADMVWKLISETVKGEVDDIISENPEKHALFEVDSLNGTRAVIRESGGKSSEFIVGKMGPNYSTTYIREPGSDAVYLVEGRLSQFYKRNASSWRNKDIVKVDKNDIAQIVLLQPESSLKFVRQAVADTLPSVWIAEDLNTNATITADPQEIDRLLNSIANFKTNDFVPVSDTDSVSFDFANPQFRVEVTLNDGSLIAFSGVPEDEEGNKFVVKRDDKDVLYSLYKGSTQRLFKSIDDFSMSTQAAPPTGAIQQTIQIPQNVPLNVNIPDEE